VIGKDTRLSGYMLETALAAGICAMGGHVMLTGPIPTPAIAQLTASMRADAGVVISASHNPYRTTASSSSARRLQAARRRGGRDRGADGRPELDRARAPGGVGTRSEDRGRRGRYVVFCKNTFPADLSLDGCASWSTRPRRGLPRRARWSSTELGAEVIALGVKPNGRNINATHGALHPEHMAARSSRRKAHLGIALDGDADRVIVVDEKGEVVDGDAIMAICARAMLRRASSPRNTSSPR
jgi:phosphoglucosamine mutase